MSTIIKQQLTSGDGQATIYIEVEDVPDIREPLDHERLGGMRGPGATARSLEAGMALIRQCASAIVDAVGGIAAAARPSEVEVSFGVKFASEIGAFIAKSGMDASLNVKLKWVGNALE
jgi:hypothetical protein